MAEESINIEQIMAQIQLRSDEIRKREATLADEDGMEQGKDTLFACCDAFSMERLEQAFSGMNSGWSVPYYRPLEGKGIKLFFKKLIRKLVAFLLAPAMTEISSFHADTVRAVGELGACVRRLEREKRELEERVRALENGSGQNRQE